MRLALAAALAALLFAGSARAQDVGVFRLFVNLQPRGDIFVRQEALGDYWVKAADLNGAGLGELRGEIKVLGGEPHVRLSSLSDVLLDVDSSELTISITAKPNVFDTQTFSLASTRPLSVTLPKASNARLNYRIGYEDAASQPSAHTWESQLAMWSRGWLFQYQDSYASDLPDHRYVRQSTNLVRDWPERMQRLNIGDLTALSGELGTTRNIGGVGFSRVFDMQPGFVSNPTARFIGAVALPSTAEIYVDGVRVASQRLSPGPFQFNNLDYYGGLRNTEVVIRDAYGGRQVLSRSVYFTDQLLRAGLQDYSYNFGVERENVGIRSSDYSGPAYSIFHRYGVSDGLTIGARSDGDREAWSAGPVAGMRVGDYGVAGVAYSLRRNTELDQSGSAWLARYTFDSRHWRARAQARWADRAYTVSAAAPDSLALPHRDTLVGAGYNSDDWGTLSFDVTRSNAHDGSFRNARTLGYSLSLQSSIQLFASLSRVKQDTGEGWEGFAGISVSLEGSRNASLTRQTIIGVGDIDTAEYSKSAPEGVGHGYRVALVRADDGTVLEPFGQLNTRNWIFSADASVKAAGDPAGSDRFGAAMAGAFVFAGGYMALTRPVQSSFVLVNVGEIEGVRVYRNNQEAGRTDERGMMVVPTVTSYAYNSISIDPQDIPMDYAITALEQTVVPPLGSGVFAKFDLRPIRAYEGTLNVRLPRGVSPMEHVGITLTKGPRVLNFTTGYGGEFYLDEAEPGDWQATFALPGVACRFQLRLPQTATAVTRLDPIVAICEPQPSP